MFLFDILGSSMSAKLEIVWKCTMTNELQMLGIVYLGFPHSLPQHVLGTYYVLATRLVEREPLFEAPPFPPTNLTVSPPHNPVLSLWHTPVNPLLMGSASLCWGPNPKLTNKHP